MGVRVVVSDVVDEWASTDPGRTEPPGSSVLDDIVTWLRGLVWSLGPVAPRTAVRPCDVVTAAATPGGSATASILLVNQQATPTTVSFWPSPLRSEVGHVWLPEIRGRSGVIVSAFEERPVELVVTVPAELPPGSYRGSLLGLAVDGTAPELVVDVGPDKVPA